MIGRARYPRVNLARWHARRQSYICFSNEVQDAAAASSKPRESLLRLRRLPVYGVFVGNDGAVSFMGWYCCGAVGHGRGFDCARA